MVNDKVFTVEEWREEGVKLFGDNISDWKFKCPKCGNVASVMEYLKEGAGTNDSYQNCIGRFKKGKGCDWAAYGLFDICKVHIKQEGNLIPVFEFAGENEVKV